MSWLNQLSGEDENDYIEVNRKYLAKIEKNSKELEVYKKALELMAKDLNSLAPVCKVNFENCPRTNGTDVNCECYECWQKDYIDKAREEA